MEKNDKKKDKRVDLIISLAAVAACVAIFLLTDTGYAPKSPAPEPEVQSTPSHVLPPSTDEFLYFLGDLPREKLEEGSYRIPGDGVLSDATLTLSLRKRAVQAFTLVLEAPRPPAEAEKEASVLEKNLAAYRKERYTEAVERMEALFSRLSRALDTPAFLSRAELDNFLYYGRLTLQSGKRQQQKTDEYVFTCFIDPLSEPPALHLSLQSRWIDR